MASDKLHYPPMTTGTPSMSTTSIHVTLPQALKDHIEKRVAEGEFTSPSDYVRAARARRAGLPGEARPPSLRDIDAGLEPTSRRAGSTMARRSSPSS